MQVRPVDLKKDDKSPRRPQQAPRSRSRCNFSAASQAMPRKRLCTFAADFPAHVNLHLPGSCVSVSLVTELGAILACKHRAFIPEYTLNKDAWKAATALQIGSETYEVVYNPPTLDKVRKWHSPSSVTQALP